MSTAIVGLAGRVSFIMALGAAAPGCSNEGLVGVRSARSGDRLEALADARGFDERAALRTRADIARNRLWVLGLDDVRVYDLADRTLIRRIALPPWSVARGVCLPDLALDRSGSAVVASNAQPTLWHIDGTSFELREYEARLQGKEGWAIGFGALRFDADGSLHGIAASGDSLWRIDLAAARAELLEVFRPPLAQCTLATYAWGGAT